jgi:hypothetical protein
MISINAAIIESLDSDIDCPGISQIGLGKRLWALDAFPPPYDAQASDRNRSPLSFPGTIEPRAWLTLLTHRT